MKFIAIVGTNATKSYNSKLLKLIPAALKSVIEWLSWKVHPLTKRPVMIVGASLGNLGTVQAQESLRRILDSPGLGSFVLPGFQFLLGRAESAFDEKGNLLDPGTVSWLEQCFNGFIHYASALEKLQSAQKAQIKTPSMILSTLWKLLLHLKSHPNRLF